MEALAAIDSFEKSFNKKPNRYPKKSLENYLDRDNTMKDRV